MRCRQRLLVLIVGSDQCVGQLGLHWPLPCNGVDGVVVVEPFCTRLQALLDALRHLAFVQAVVEALDFRCPHLGQVDGGGGLRRRVGEHGHKTEGRL